MKNVLACARELIQTQKLWDKIARANLLILHLCSSFKLSLALCSLLSNLYFSSLLIVRSLSPLCHHEWDRILKCDLMSLVFLLSIFLPYPSTFICSLSPFRLFFFHTQGLIAEVSDSLPLHFFPFIVSLGPYSVAFQIIFYRVWAEEKKERV